MSTQLESFFEFSSIDLAANRNGHLSTQQQETYETEKDHLKSLVRIHFFGRMITAVVFLLLVANRISLLVNNEDYSGSGVIDLMWYIGGGVYLGLTYFHGIHRSRQQFLTQGKVVSIPTLRREDFTQPTDHECGKYMLSGQDYRIVLTYRQFESLQPTTTYRLYCWAYGDKKASEILSVEATDGSSAPATSPLEHAFRFSPDDLAANHMGSFSTAQVCDMRDAYALEYLRAFTTIFAYLTIFGIIVMMTFYDLGAGVFSILGLFAPFIASYMLILLFIRMVRSHRESQHVLAVGAPDVLHGMRKTDINQISSPTGTTFYKLPVGESFIRFTDEQFNALNDTASYNIYYFAARWAMHNYPILSVEKTEPIS